MKVLFLSRSTLHTSPGGDTVQITETAKHLENLGIQVKTLLAGEPMPEGYDLVHFFNLIRPADALRYLHSIHTPLVISPIYVDYSSFDRQSDKTIVRTLTRPLNKFQMEYIKTWGRALKGQDSRPPLAYWPGHFSAMKTLVNRASMLLPNSENEARRFSKDLKLPFDFRVVPNAINSSIFYREPAIERQANLILCVGQFDGRKNQHRLIEATKDLDVDLVLIGKASPNHSSYKAHCESIAHARVTFIEQLPQQELRTWYNRAAVHALPSWFETTGLSSLEAAACGCKLVVSDTGDTKDYFEGFASFCQPDSTSSIRNALTKALNEAYQPEFEEHIKSKYTWQNTAQQTLNAYNEILN